MARWLILGFAMAGLIGASAALLLATERGNETRRFVRSRAEPAVSKVRHVATRLAKRGESAPGGLDGQEEPDDPTRVPEVYRYQ
jgi:gas vesicle protein